MNPALDLGVHAERVGELVGPPQHEPMDVGLRDLVFVHRADLGVVVVELAVPVELDAVGEGLGLGDGGRGLRDVCGETGGKRECGDTVTRIHAREQVPFVE